MRFVTLILLAFATVLAGCGGGGSVGVTDPVYDDTTLPTKNDQPASEGWFVDNDGRVFGATYNAAGTPTMCVWLPGETEPRSLDIPEEAAASIIQKMSTIGCCARMNNLNQICYVGTSTAGIVNLMTGATIVLGTPNSINPVDVNDAGVCVGSGNYWGGPPGSPVIWTTDGQHWGRSASNCDCGVANSISNSGRVVGTMSRRYCSGTQCAVIWDSRGYVWRQILTDTDIYGWARVPEGILISDSGHTVVKRSYTYLLIGPDGQTTEFGNAGTRVGAINARGQVAGYGGLGEPKVWNPDGSVITLTLPNGSVRCEVHDINDNGLVVGTAIPQDWNKRAAVTWRLGR